MKVLGILFVTCFTYMVEAQMKVADKKNFSFKCGDKIYLCGSLTQANVPNVPGATYETLSTGFCSDLVKQINQSELKPKIFVSRYTCPNGKKADSYVVYKCKVSCYVCNGTACTKPKNPCPGGCGPKCPVGGGGDPHFRTYDGTSYSYHGQCDLVMARSPTFDSGLGLTVHARTKIIGGWSLISNAAVKIGDDVFELNHNKSHYLNGIENADLPLLLAGKYSVTSGNETIGSYDNDSSAQTWYNIDLENGQNIRITNFKTMISVKVDADLNDTAGMLGMTSTPGLVARDGKTIIEEPNDMGSEWQVITNVEPMLFQEIRAPQYPESCILPTVTNNIAVSTNNRRRLHGGSGNYQSRRRAEEACVDVEDNAMRNFCVEDVLLTGEIDIARKYGDLF